MARKNLKRIPWAVSVLTILLLSWFCFPVFYSSTVKAETAQVAPVAPQGKTLIVYYTLTGKHKIIAEELKKQLELRKTVRFFHCPGCGKSGLVEIQKLMPEAEAIKEAGKWEPFGKHAEYYDGIKGGNAVGYIASTYGKGYSSYISILVAVDPSIKVKKISILGHGETPGLGDEIEQDYFLKRFEGKSLEQLVVVKVEGTDKIQAISGATISSRAVTNGVKEAVKLLKEKYQGGQGAKQ